MGLIVALLSLAFIGLFGIGGVFAVRVLISKDRDKERVSYQLFFPTDLPCERATAYFRELGTLLRSSVRHGTQTMAFEVLMDGGQIEWRVHVPWQLKEVAINKLRTLVPGASAVQIKPDDPRWSRAVEVGESNKSAPLYIPNTRDAVMSMLSHNGALRDGERLMIQVVVSSAGLQQMSQPRRKGGPWWMNLGSTEPSKHHDEKVSEPNVNALVRVASKATTEERSKKIIHDVATSFRPMARQPNGWTFRSVPQGAILNQATNAASSFRWPAQFNAAELLAIVAWPVDSPDVSGLPRGSSRQLPPNPSIPKSQIVIGHSTYAGKERPVGLSYRGGLQHTHIIGGTGSGKTTLAANMAMQDMAAGHTVIIMEPKGDLMRLGLERVPLDRYDDVIILDVSDTDYPLGFNVLRQGNPRVAAGNFKSLMQHLYPDLKTSLYARSALNRGLETLMLDPDSSFVDLVPLFSPSMRSDAETAWRDALIAKVDDPDLEEFWRKFNGYKKEEQERYAAPLMNRIWIVNETPEVRNIFGQSESSFTFEQVFRENKILFINFAGLPDDVASLAGTLLMQAMWTDIQRLEGVEKKDAFLYLDEFQSFMKLPVGAADMLNKSRSFGLGMRLAHQHLDQIKPMPDLASAVTNNTKNKIVYQTSASDGNSMAKEFGSAALTGNDFQNLRQYEAYARVMTDEGQSAPFSMRALAPSKPIANALAIRNASREKYGRPRLQVVADMQNRRRVAGETATPRRSRPKISGEDGW